jgi:carbonic anhydrase
LNFGIELFVEFQVGKENSELQKIVDLLPSIYHRGEKTAIKEPIDPAKLLPGMVSSLQSFHSNNK